MAHDLFSPSVSFWRRLVISIFRIAVRLTFRINRLSLAELKRLLGIAIVLELRDQGLSIHKSAIALGCAPGTIRNMLQDSREVQGEGATNGIVHHLLLQLREKSLTREELERLLPYASRIRFCKSHLAAPASAPAGRGGRRSRAGAASSYKNRTRTTRQSSLVSRCAH